MEDKKDNEKIELTVLKGDKLFNQNTPFVINLSSKDPDINSKRCNADLICVIDTSSSMRGKKIYQVKESLKILIDLMDKNDRLALILFNRKATKLFDLQLLTKQNKIDLKKQIDLFETNKGTNILSGLKLAIDILKKEKEENNEEGRVSSVLLLSDGCDSRYNDIQLADSLKKMTKGLELEFTLHTFGYGNYYDDKIMKKLAVLRDGSFYYVEDYNKVSEYFACVLGGCISVLSKRAQLNVNLLNKNCKIVKIFGGENLYEYELNDDNFQTTMLQFICGKEYSFVLEIQIDENNIKIGEEFLEANFEFEDISQNNKIINEYIKYNYELSSLNYKKANEEYIRSQVYDILAQVMKLRENGEKDKAKEMLVEIKEWINTKYEGDNKDYLIDIEKSYELFGNNASFVNASVKLISSQIIQNQSKKQGSNMNFCNSIQRNLMQSISNN